MRALRSSRLSLLMGPFAYLTLNGRFIQNTFVPPTLGECLTERIIGRGHTYEDAATAIGTSPSEVEGWANDRDVPDLEVFDGLMGYLGVDLKALKALILRSQMRRAQRRIHGIPASR